MVTSSSATCCSRCFLHSSSACARPGSAHRTASSLAISGDTSMKAHRHPRSRREEESAGRQHKERRLGPRLREQPADGRTAPFDLLWLLDASALEVCNRVHRAAGVRQPVLACRRPTRPQQSQGTRAGGQCRNLYVAASAASSMPSLTASSTPRQRRSEARWPALDAESERRQSAQPPLRQQHRVTSVTSNA